MGKFLDLSLFPLFTDPKALIHLKAASLFHYSKLFDSPQLEISCRTSQNISRTENSVSLTLVFRPRVPDLTLSTYLITLDYIQAHPSFVGSRPLVSEFEQTFTFKSFAGFRLIEMPRVQITCASRGQTQEIALPLPFTVNKFFRPIPPTQAVFAYLERAREFLSTSLKLDKDIIDNGYQLKEIFPDLITLDAHCFALFIGIYPDVNCVLQLQLHEPDLIGLSILSEEEHPIFLDIIKWFFWIFAAGN